MSLNEDVQLNNKTLYIYIYIYIYIKSGFKLQS